MGNCGGRKEKIGLDAYIFANYEDTANLLVTRGSSFRNDAHYGCRDSDSKSQVSDAEIEDIEDTANLVTSFGCRDSDSKSQVSSAPSVEELLSERSVTSDSELRSELSTLSGCSSTPPSRVGRTTLWSSNSIDSTESLRKFRKDNTPTTKHYLENWIWKPEGEKITRSRNQILASPLMSELERNSPPAIPRLRRT